MSRRYTAAEAQALLDDVAANADHKCDGEVVGGDCASCDAMGDALIALRNAAPDLAATVAAEPARIAAAVAAERAAIVAQIKASEEKYRDALRKCRDHSERDAYREGANALGAIAHEIARRTP